MDRPISHLYEFGEFRLNGAERLLQRRGVDVPLPPKVFDLLLALVENHGHVVTKDQLLSQLWPDTFVEETNLKVYVSTLRKALGDGDGKFIETLTKRGYRFVAPVTEILPASADDLRVSTASGSERGPDLVVEKRAVSRIVIEEQVDESANAAARALLPASRFQMSPGRAMALGLGLAALVALGWFLWSRSRSEGRQVRSLAVLPFTMLAGAQDGEHLGVGLADALITRLGATGAIPVRPTSAIQKYTTAERDPLEIGRRLEVEAVLDGRVQRAGDELRLTVQLLRTGDGAQLWAESFDEQGANIFAIQRAMSEKIARLLTVKLSDEHRQRLNKKYTENTAAFEAYVRGRFLYGKQDQESLLKAIEHYRQATELDPGYALAWAGMADCYVLLNLPTLTMGIAPPEESLIRARAAAEKAVELDESLAEAHLSLAAVIATWIHDDAAAHREFQRAIELNPNLAQAHSYYGMKLMGDARLEEALVELERARQLDPLSPSINTNLGMTLSRLRRYDEAATQFQKTLRMDPNFIRAHQGLGMVYEQQKRFDEAIAEFRKAEQLSGGGIVPLGALGYVYAFTGRRGEAERILSRLLERERENETSPYYIATVYAGLGDKDQVFAWLEKIKHLRTIRLIKTDPRFDSLRDDPRFAALLLR
jgi:tetratricopeptide (TPR) repeat protein/DNA-binding winged helix-turn-helix (wHTH) protein